MLNEVRIFEALIFYSVLDSNFTNSRPDSYNFSQGDSQGVNFTARSYDLAHSGVVLSLVGGLLAVSFRLHSASDMSIVHWLLRRRSFTKMRCWSAHPCRSQHQAVVQEYSSFTESVVLHMQHAMCHLSRGRFRRQMGNTECLGTFSLIRTSRLGICGCCCGRRRGWSD